MGGEIFISENLSLVGSIGIIIEIPNYEKLYKKFHLIKNII
jgi:ClpP class serine protease